MIRRIVISLVYSFLNVVVVLETPIQPLPFFATNFPIETILWVFGNKHETLPENGLNFRYFTFVSHFCGFCPFVWRFSLRKNLWPQILGNWNQNQSQTNNKLSQIYHHLTSNRNSQENKAHRTSKQEPSSKSLCLLKPFVIWSPVLTIRFLLWNFCHSLFRFLCVFFWLCFFFAVSQYF